MVHTHVGIFGYYVFNVNKDIQAVLDALFNGLKRLEYRGYDSAGIAIDVHDAYPLAQAVRVAWAGVHGQG